ncbi:SDR family NAD(P)-dependent oxidoreductase [Ferrimonas senticii]|uniref:SDR family NAD(P)-dependent oxidoreductase n=1 Tax=Ferrimonas senticii TaxID=394566 RepID=UPI0004104199|nr:SDR family NAD(P)-dependent oxidoreductase [Ferrimonas senticii]
MFNFDGQVIVITGAGRGLGRAYSLALASRGAHIVAIDNGCDIDGHGVDSSYLDDLRETIEDMGYRMSAYCVDVTQQQRIADVLDEVYQQHGRIDGLICNAGLMLLQSAEDEGNAKHLRQLDVNHVATVAMIEHVLPLMRTADAGRIVVTGGLSPLYGDPRLMGFAASMSANMGYARCLAVALSDSNININIIAPANYSRLTSQLDWPFEYELFTADLVVPAVLWLLAESAPNGVTISAGGGHYSLIESMESEGVMPDLVNLRPQVVANAIQGLMHQPKNQVYKSFKQRMGHILKQLMIKQAG